MSLQNSKPPKDNLSKDERKALKELQSDTSIVVLLGDKVRSAVNREDYLENCLDHINQRRIQRGRRGPASARPPIFCSQLLFFAVTLKHYKLCYLKLN